MPVRDVSEILVDMVEQLPEESRTPHALGQLVAERGMTLEEVGIISYPCCGKMGSCNHGRVPLQSETPSVRYSRGDELCFDGIEDFVKGFFSVELVAGEAK